MRLLQHPQRNYHDDGLHDHVVSGLCVCLCLCLQARKTCISAFAHGPSFDILEIPHTRRSVTVMDKVEVVCARDKLWERARRGRTAKTDKERKEEGESVLVKDTDRWKERERERVSLGHAGVCGMPGSSRSQGPEQCCGFPGEAGWKISKM